MVNSRSKGKRGEHEVVSLLNKYTDMKWARVPLSGGLDKVHGLKGDVYTPDADSRYCIEVKRSKNDPVSSKLLVGLQSPLLDWWVQAKRQALECEKLPLLVFRADRLPWLAISEKKPNAVNSGFISVATNSLYIVNFESALIDKLWRF